MPIKFGFKKPELAPVPKAELDAVVETLKGPPEPDTRPDPMGISSREFLASSKITGASLKAVTEETIPAINRLAHFHRLRDNLKLGTSLFKELPELVKAGKHQEAKAIVSVFWDTYKKVMTKGKLQRPQFYD